MRPSRSMDQSPIVAASADESSTVRREEWGIGVQQTVDSTESLERGREIVGAAHRHRFELHAQRARGGLRPLQLVCVARMLRMRQYGDSLQRRNELLEQLKALSSHSREIDSDSGDVPAGVSETRDETDLNRFVHGEEDNGYGRGCSLGGHSA